MGADIKLSAPSESNLPLIISDDAYNLELQGEPNCVLKIQGPSKLKAAKLSIKDVRSGPALILAALCSKGSSVFYDFEILDIYYEDMISKLIDLGAKIDILGS